jgi:hypothetical protein
MSEKMLRETVHFCNSLKISDLNIRNHIVIHNPITDRPLWAVGVVCDTGVDVRVSCLFIGFCPLPGILRTTALQSYNEENKCKKNEYSKREKFCSKHEKFNKNVFGTAKTGLNLCRIRKFSRLSDWIW